MLMVHYAHRLPADHDLGAIRARAAARGPQWDATPGLAFKAFLLRERGVLGAAAHDYSSLYLWHRTEAFASFVGDERFRAVTDSFGRPSIEARPVIAARRGDTGAATHLVKRSIPIGRDADLGAVLEREREAAAAQARHAGVVATIAAIDVERWSIVRVVLVDRPPVSIDEATIYTILYLAMPGLAEVPPAPRATT